MFGFIPLHLLYKDTYIWVAETLIVIVTIFPSGFPRRTISLPTSWTILPYSD